MLIGKFNNNVELHQVGRSTLAVMVNGESKAVFGAGATQVQVDIVTRWIKSGMVGKPKFPCSYCGSSHEADACTKWMRDNRIDW